MGLNIRMGCKRLWRRSEFRLIISQMATDATVDLIKLGEPELFYRKLNGRSGLWVYILFEITFKFLLVLFPLGICLFVESN
jgi:hypothetical protein